MKRNCFLIVLIISVFLGGCLATVNHSDPALLGRKNPKVPYAGNPDKFLKSENAQNLTQDQKDCVRDRTVFNDLCLGMPNYAIAATIGLPHKMDESVTKHGKREIWIYRSSSRDTVYVFLENRRLSGWKR